MKKKLNLLWNLKFNFFSVAERPLTFFAYFLNAKKVGRRRLVISPAKAGAFLFSHTRLPFPPRPLLPFGRISLRETARRSSAPPFGFAAQNRARHFAAHSLGGRPLRGHGFAAPHRHFPLPAAAAPTTVSGCCFLTNMNRKHNIQPEIWYNNLKPAACAAARSSCADALSRTGLENIEPCKTAVNAVLSRPLRGAMV